jgi:hypothetical protein
MVKSLYTLSQRGIMKTRAYFMHVSADGGKTFTRYASAGAFEKQTGHSVSTRWRAEVIEANGANSMQIGDRTPNVARTMQGVPFTVFFERKK